MQWLIASALGTDLNTSVRLSMKAVSSLINLNAGIHLRCELQRQVKGIAVRIIPFSSSYGLIFVLGDIGRVELYPVAKHPSYVCRNRG